MYHNGRVQTLSPVDILMRRLCLYYVIFSFSNFGLYAIILYQFRNDLTKLQIGFVIYLAILGVSLVTCNLIELEFTIYQSFQSKRPLSDFVNQIGDYGDRVFICIILSLFLSTVIGFTASGAAETHPSLFYLVKSVFILLSILANVCTIILLIIPMGLRIRRRAIADEVICIGRIDYKSPDKDLYCPVRKAPAYFWHFVFHKNTDASDE